MTRNEQLEAQKKHDKIRNILIDYGNEEYGDCIIDEICQAVGIPNTTDIADEEGVLHPQSYYKK